LNEDLRERYPNVRNDLIAARRARGITQYEAAMRLDVSWPYYSMIELGEVTPEPRLAAKITKLTGYEWEE
jgi:DNA-binding XRE family transcriptional regulator